MGTLGALWALRADGEEFPIEASISQVKTGGGKLFTVIVRDITERKKAEEALRESAARERARAKELEVILDAVPLPVRIAQDTACRRMTGNRAAYEQTRVPAGGNLSSSVLPAEGPRYRVMEDGVWVAADMLPMQQAAATGKSVYGRALTIVYEDGTKRETVENAVPLLDEAGKPFGAVGTSIDLTELKQAEEALHQSESTQRLILDHLSVGVILSSVGEERALYQNPKFLELFGYSNEQVPTVEEWWTLAYPDPVYRASVSQEWHRRITVAAETQGEIEPMEVTVRCQDGTDKYVRVLAKVISNRNFVTFIDLTERKHAEQSLYQSEQLKASILESLSNHIVVTDSRGIVVAVNDAKFDIAANKGLLGVDVGENYFEICRSMIEEDNLEVRVALDGIQRVFDGERDYFELEYAVNPANQQPWLFLSVTPLKGADRGIVISHRDVSERKRHEKAIHELSGRLIDAQEQERSRIARELHDDVNQQLALLAIELQQLESFFPEASSDGRQQVQALWKKMHILSTEIQQLSHQLHSTKLEHLGIVAALRGLCNEFSAQHKIAADFQCQQVPPTMGSDASLSLFRVAQESLHNTAKHSRAHKVRMELIGEGGRVILRVSDDGVGFDPAAQKNQTGLGMISMAERVRFAGGTLSVWSKPSMGTQVEAAIPLSRRTGTATNASPSSFARRKTDRS